MLMMLLYLFGNLLEALGFEDVSDNEAKNNKAMGRFMKNNIIHMFRM